MSLTATDSPSRRPRRKPRPKPRGRIANAPVTIRIGLPAALVFGLIYWSVGEWVDATASLQVVDGQGAVPEGLRIELFAHEPEKSSASPTAKLADFESPEGALQFTADDLAGSSALARVSAPGFGLSWSLLEVGVQSKIELGAPAIAEGKIFAPPALLAGARVQAFGGGSRGVLLMETETRGDGSFTLEGFSENLRYLLVRVFQEGFAVQELDWEIRGRSSLDLTLEATKLLKGSIEFCEGLMTQPMELRAYQVPGVSARSDDQGKFVMKHLPAAPLKTAILLSSLPPEFTHRRLQVQANDQPVKLVVARSAMVHGQVVNGNNGQGVPAAKVYHEHGPAGLEIVVSDANGYFEIGRLPPGEVRLDADIMIQTRAIPSDPASAMRRKLIQGHVIVDCIEGETLPDVMIKVY